MATMSDSRFDVGPPKKATHGSDIERQYVQAVRGVFATPLGQYLLKEMKLNTARPFAPDPYRTAYNCGAQDFVQTLIEITEEK